MPAARPSREFLATQIRWVRSRGVPAEDAEDIVFAAYQKASDTHDPERGAFEPYMAAIVRNAAAYWWRGQGRTDRAHAHLRLVADASDARRAESAAQKQAAVLEALDPGERAVFAAWALQKHLGKGRVTSAEMSASLGLEPPEYENAKKRLKSRLHRLLERFGWTTHDVIHGEDDASRVG